MGNNLCVPENAPAEHFKQQTVQQVQEILEDFPETLRNSVFRGSTTRYSDLSVINENSNRYIFLLKIDGKEVKVVIPVINELAHRALVETYKLSISKEMIIDPFEERIQSTLIPVYSDVKQSAYSMRIVPFRGYNGLAFKRVLQELWVYRQLQKKQDRLSEDPRSLFLWLEDCFIYGVNADQQAVVMLYERVEGSLLLAADFRWKACQRWKEGERLKILRDVVKGCNILSQLSLVHRDVRASNIYFSQKQKRYVLGGFGCSRQVRKEVDEDLMTVSGIESQTGGKLKQLLSGKQNVGIYNAKEGLYYQLRVLNRLLDSRRIADQLGESEFRESVFINIQSMLRNCQQLGQVLTAIEGGMRIGKFGEFGEESDIVSRLFKLLPARYRDLSQRYLFKVYSTLGYQIEFSEMAHKMIEKNNIEGNSFANAKILKDLGLFFQKHGTSGTEYLLNACVLYCKETQIEMQKGLFDDATLKIEQGEEVYIRLSGAAGEFAMSMIDLKRLRTELRARTIWQLAPNKVEQEKMELMKLMSKTLELAAGQNLPIEKQMKLFLTWGVVHRQCVDKVAAEERFRNGLSICENEGAFESHSSASLLKSHFLYEISLMKLDTMQDQHDPLLPHDKQTYSPEDLPKQIENWIQESLEIRQKVSTRVFQTIQCYMLLGRLYMLQNQYLQAKVQLKRAMIRLLDLEKSEKIPYETIVEVHYDLGSVNYKLQDYQESVDHYREGIVILQERGGDQYWINVIAGNLGLSYLRAGLTEKGKGLLEKAKEAIQVHHGKNHYDYMFLSSQEEIINASDEKKE